MNRRLGIVSEGDSVGSRAFAEKKLQRRSSSAESDHVDSTATVFVVISTSSTSTGFSIEKDPQLFCVVFRSSFLQV